MYENILLYCLGFVILLASQIESQEAFSFKGGNSENLTITEGGDKFVECFANGSVETVWRNSKNEVLPNTAIQSADRIFLIISNMGPSLVGTYTCTAKNNVGQTIVKTYHLSMGSTRPTPRTMVPDESPTSTGTGTSGAETDSGTFIGGISMTIVVVTLLIVWIFFEFFRKPKNGLTKEEIEEFLLGNIEAIQNNGYAHENAPYMPYSESYEIPDSRLYVDPKDVLGSGQFGIVLRGKVNNKPVAIKTLRPGVEKTQLKSLLAELKIMIYLGVHDNIVNLIGASTKKLALGSVYIVVECCDLGSLEKYLRTRQPEFVNQFDDKGRITKKLDCEEMCTTDLVTWSAQIANGMAYMGTKNVIHGDLASRNVLLSERRNVKITDFGLSRQLYDYTTNYQKHNMEPLPWRWMAYESLRELSFSCKSDIWSYGVTIWEIFTLGEVPYPGLSWTHEFVGGLLENRRLPKPKYATMEIYHQMLKSWNIDPKRRASFQNSKDFFENILEPGETED